MIKRIIWTVAVLLLVGPGLLWASGSESHGGAEAAVNASKAWLALVDRGDADASWAAAATLFQKGVDKAMWKKTVVRIRTAMGATGQRKVIGAQPAKSLPGAPDGEYVVIRLSTRFQNQENAVETVTMVEDGGTFKTAGYFIK